MNKWEVPEIKAYKTLKRAGGEEKHMDAIIDPINSFNLLAVLLPVIHSKD